MATLVRKIAYHEPFLDHREREAAAEVVASGRIGGGGKWLEQAERMLKQRLGAEHLLVVSSCTHALEMLTMLYGIGPGDEVIVPAYTFSSTATCVARQGARIVFADVREEDLNVDPADVARRVTDRTKAIFCMHYAGVPCDMTALQSIARARGIPLLEDAAHAFDSRWHGKACGALADGGAHSFQSSKNITAGEGGALIVPNEQLLLRAERIREMGTNRAAARRGEVFRYTWHDIGSSLIPAEVLMAILVVQLQKADEILKRRRAIFWRYHRGLEPLEQQGLLCRPTVPADVEISGHIFYALFPTSDVRTRVQQRLAERGIETHTHYVSLDGSPYGSTHLKPGDSGCPRSRSITDRMARLPLHPRLSDDDVDYVIAELGSALAAG